MKVKDLQEEIDRCRKEYGEAFLDWDVYTEQISEVDKQYKRDNPQWKWLVDSEEWEYLECAGWWTKFTNEKAFTINVNY